MNARRAKKAMQKHLSGGHLSPRERCVVTQRLRVITDYFYHQWWNRQLFFSRRLVESAIEPPDLFDVPDEPPRYLGMMEYRCVASGPVGYILSTSI
jgi:hypothetical protein